MANVEWRLTQNASQSFRAIQDQMEDPQPAFKRMLVEVEKAQRAWFHTEGGGRWAPLSYRYGVWKGNKFPGRRKMHGPDFPVTEPRQLKNGTWTAGRAVPHIGGALRDDLTRNSRTNPNKFGIETVTARGFIFGTKIAYAEVHNRGLVNKPRRRLIAPMGGPVMHKFEGIMLDHLLAEAGRGKSFKSSGSILGKGSKKGNRR